MSSSSGQDPGTAMAASWQDDDEEFKLENLKGRPKSRFSFTEVKALLRCVTKNRFIVLRKFNSGVTAESKKQAWMEITEEINALGENHREVRQIMKKWADLKCDGKRRMIAMRSSNDTHLRKRNLGPVEKMVHKILMMSPDEGGDSELDFGPEELKPKIPRKRRNTRPPAYLDSPLSSPEKDLAGEALHSSSDLELPEDGDADLDETEPYSEPDDDPEPPHVLAWNGAPPTPPGPSGSAPAPPSSLRPARPERVPPPPGAPGPRPDQQVAALAAQSLQQQQAGRALLGAVSQSLDVLAQSVQLLVETQQEFVQESLLLQRETVDVLRDFSNTALAMLRDKAGAAPARQRPAF